MAFGNRFRNMKMHGFHHVKHWIPPGEMVGWTWQTAGSAVFDALTNEDKLR